MLTSFRNYLRKYPSKTIQVFSLGLLVAGLTAATIAVSAARTGFFNLQKKAAENTNQLSQATQDPDISARAKTETSELITLLQEKTSSRTAAAPALAQVKKRKQTMIELMKNDPKAFLQIGLPEKIRSQFGEEIKNEIETEVALEGQLSVIHFDNIDQKRSAEEYFLDTADNQRLQLFFADIGQPLPANSQVKISGLRLENLLAVPSSWENHVKVLSPAKNTGGGEIKPQVKKLAVILFNFQDNPAQPWSPADIKNWTFTDSDSVFAYYKEASFAKLSLSGDVFGWYTIPFNQNPCNSWDWSRNARDKVSQEGVNLDDYDYFVYAFPYVGSCWAAGWATIAGPESWINGYYDGSRHSVVNHELGHNFGAHHANAYECFDQSRRRVPISNNCQSLEYNDPFDVMGYYGSYHMNNYHKGQVGWLSPKNTLTTSKSGRYTISPIETPTNSIQALRIPRKTDIAGRVSQYYYLEYRRPFGFDNFGATDPVVTGVSLRLATDYPVLYYQSQLIDTTAAETPWSWTDAALTRENIFEDRDFGVKLEVQQVSAKAAKVKIDRFKPTCVRAKPELTLYPIGQWGRPGETLWYYLMIKNQDSNICGASTFRIDPTLFSEWKQTPDPLTVTIMPEETQYLSFLVQSSYNTPDGYYSFTETAIHPAGSDFNAAIAANYNVYTMDTTPPSVKIYDPQPQATVSGQNSRIGATATDNIRMDSVEFFLDKNRSLGKSWSGSADFIFYWSTLDTSNGPHQLTAAAADTSGNTATSAAVNIMVSNIPLTPTVSPPTTITPTKPPPPTPTKKPNPTKQPTPTPTP